MYTRIAQLRTAAQFSEHLQSLGISLDFDSELIPPRNSPLAQTYHLPITNYQHLHLAQEQVSPITNRWCILPMEGWDGTTDGKPTELTTRRWQRFGQSGAKLIWGGEAVAVRPDGRANPYQLIINEDNIFDLAELRHSLIQAHASRWNTDDFLIGLQLTHSGRFCRPNDKKRMEPRILYHHPLLDGKFGLPDDYTLMSDDEIGELFPVIRKARLMVCNDTGPMHIAAALGVPIIALFGPTSPQWTGPYGDGHTVVWKAMPCSPCPRRGCKTIDCMDTISVQEVFETVKRYL